MFDLTVAISARVYPYWVFKANIGIFGHKLLIAAHLVLPVAAPALVESKKYIYKTSHDQVRKRASLMEKMAARGCNITSTNREDTIMALDYRTHVSLK